MDLPAPFWPTRPMRSPAWATRLTSANNGSPSYVFVRPEAVRTGAPDAEGLAVVAPAGATEGTEQTEEAVEAGMGSRELEGSRGWITTRHRNR
ncbi:hypothetical protein GCM10009872_58160 [Actinopolymorpha rutila]